MLISSIWTNFNQNEHNLKKIQKNDFYVIICFYRRIMSFYPIWALIPYFFRIVVILVKFIKNNFIVFLFTYKIFEFQSIELFLKKIKFFETFIFYKTVCLFPTKWLLLFWSPNFFCEMPTTNLTTCKKNDGHSTLTFFLQRVPFQYKKLAQVGKFVWLVTTGD